MKSIRAQLARQILAGASALLLVAGVIFGIAAHSRLNEAFDHALGAKAAALVSLTVRDGRMLDLEFGGGAMTAFDADGDPEYFEVFLPDGTVLKKSPALGGGDLPFDPELSGEGGTFRNVRLPDGRRGRLVRIVFTPEADEPDDAGNASPDEDMVELPATVDADSLRIVLAVARSRERLDGLLLSIDLTLGVLSVLLLGGIQLVVRRAIGRGFAPIDAMNAQIARIGPDTLGDRVRIESPPEEIAAMLAALNGLIERVERGFARERRFSSDVAHELRTPVAELRTACEVGARWPDDPEAVGRFFEDARAIALQMEGVVANLLLLANAERGSVDIARRSVAVGPLVQTCWDRLNGAGSNHRLDNRIDSALSVETDAATLEMIVQNLLGNAVAHGVPGTAIVCEGAATGAGIDLTISNPAAGLSDEDVAHVFERFWRKDPARTGHERAGLGLSIVRALAAQLGIGVRARLIDGGVFEIRLSFPAAPPRKIFENFPAPLSGA